jgi:hypothetical protein
LLVEFISQYRAILIAKIRDIEANIKNMPFNINIVSVSGDIIILFDP